MFPQGRTNASRKKKLLLPPFCQGSCYVCGVRLRSVTSSGGRVYRFAPAFDVPAEPGKCIKEEEIASVPVLPGQFLRLRGSSVLCNFAPGGVYRPAPAFDVPAEPDKCTKDQEALLPPFCQGSSCVCGPCLRSETSPLAEFVAPRLHLMFPQSLTNHQGRGNCFCPVLSRQSLRLRGSSALCNFAGRQSLSPRACV